MTKSTRLLPAVLGLLALSAVALVLERGAGAEEGTPARKAPATWVFDVRVVRVDEVSPATVEAAPSWQPSGEAGATTKAPWADLLTGLKARGRTTILLDQRVTAFDREKTEFKQDRKRVVLLLRNRQDNPQGKLDISDSSYVETGTRGELVPSPDLLTYAFDARWEEGPGTDGTPSPLGSTTWRGSHANFPSGETLVLSYRQQPVPGPTGTPGLEIYVFVTGWSAAAK